MKSKTLKSLNNYRQRIKNKLEFHYKLHMQDASDCNDIYGYCSTSKYLVGELTGIDKSIRIVKREIKK